MGSQGTFQTSARQPLESLESPPWGFMWIRSVLEPFPRKWAVPEKEGWENPSHGAIPGWFSLPYPKKTTLDWSSPHPSSLFYPFFPHPPPGKNSSFNWLQIGFFSSVSQEFAGFVIHEVELSRGSLKSRKTGITIPENLTELHSPAFPGSFGFISPAREINGGKSRSLFQPKKWEYP